MKAGKTMLSNVPDIRARLLHDAAVAQAAYLDNPSPRNVRTYWQALAFLSYLPCLPRTVREASP
jgi:hypothetical protein